MAAAAMQAQLVARPGHFELQRRNAVTKGPETGMTEEGVPAEVREFLLACIDSVAELEALLLLRENPGQDWDATTLARRLYVTDTEGAKILDHLVQCSLAERTAGSSCPASFAPCSPARALASPV